MIISRRHGFIFIKSAKCAGTSIEVYLGSLCGPHDVVTPMHEPEPAAVPRNYLGDFDPLPELRYLGSEVLGHEGVGSTPRLLYTHRDRVNRRLFHEAMPAWQVLARMGQPFFDQFFSFAVERNPWDKVLSRVDHLNAVGVPTTIDDLLDRLEVVSSSRFAQLAPLNFPRYADPRTGRVLVDRVVQYERLGEELGEVLSDLGLPFPGRLPVRAKGGYRTDRRPYRQRFTDEQASRVASIFAREITLMDYQW
jgi:hypothetical protein